MPDVPSRCRTCGTEIAPQLLACPGCGALVHTDELKRLAAAAQNARTPAEGLAFWREALAYLPPDSQQHALIVSKIDALRQQADQAPASERKATSDDTKRKTGLAGLAAVVVGLLLKFKFALIFLLTKAKLLLLGFTKISTLLSMLASFGVYWAAWGWKFAAGFVLSIYVHEMGHIERLRRYGIRCTAPMFIPGFGALIRLKEHLPTAIEEARVGLAGPWWGLGAATACWLLWLGTDAPIFAALAKVGAWINMFNLTPVWQLDGSHAFRALSRTQRWLASASLGGAFFVTNDGFVMIIAIVAGARSIGSDAPEQGDARTLGEFVFLVAALSALMLLRPMAGY